MPFAIAVTTPPSIPPVSRMVVKPASSVAAGRGEDVLRDLGDADPKREVRLDRARQAQADTSVDQAGRHRQSLGIETLAVRAGGTESGDAAVLDGDVDVAGIAPRSVDDRRARDMSRSDGRSSAVAS
ncbi:hypothetical protein OG501_01545 [Streptomyces niveus]|uniref:hypothetical protein n=1 Tax=Streptomyces niveus TaxID=193462 RepID=UPI00386BEC8D